MRICRQCEEPYTLLPTKPGHIDDCPRCVTEDVPLLMAKVAYPSKNSSEVEIEITADRGAATAFNKAQRRSSATCLSSIVTPKEDKSGRESSKSGSGAELGAIYSSKLLEKYSVKR